jgi:hypothetical protein
MSYLRKQVIQDGKIVYQDFGSSSTPPVQTKNPYSNHAGYPADLHQAFPPTSQSFPPPVPQAAPPPVMPSTPAQHQTEIVTSSIYVHPFVWLFGLLVFTVMMTGLLRPTVIMPYGGGGTTNNFVLPGAGGQ